jgi:hypothetical protein
MSAKLAISMQSARELRRRFVDHPDHCACDRLINIAVGERRATQGQFPRDSSSNSARFSGSSGRAATITMRS